MLILLLLIYITLVAITLYLNYKFWKQLKDKERDKKDND